MLDLSLGVIPTSELLSYQTVSRISFHSMP